MIKSETSFHLLSKYLQWIHNMNKNKFKKYPQNTQSRSNQCSLSIKNEGQKQYERPNAHQLIELSRTTQSTYLDRLKSELSQFLRKKTISTELQKSNTNAGISKKPRKFSHGSHINQIGTQSKQRPPLYRKHLIASNYRARQAQKEGRKLQDEGSIKKGEQSLKDLKNKSFTIKQIRPEPKLKIVKDSIVFMNGESFKLGSYFELMSLDKDIGQKKKFDSIKKRNLDLSGNKKSMSWQHEKSLNMNILKKGFVPTNLNNFHNLEPWQEFEEFNDDIFSKIQ